MKRLYFSLKGVLFALLLLSFHHVYGQELWLEGDSIYLELQDQSLINGVVVEIADENVLVSINGSLQKIALDEVVSIRKKSEKNSYRNEFYYDRTRYSSSRNFLTSTAFTLEKGEMYYHNQELFLNSFSYGFTDRLMFTVGAELGSFLFDSEIYVPPLYLELKTRIPVEDNFNISLGLHYISVLQRNSRYDGIAFPAVNFTMGSRQNNFTFGGGIAKNLAGGEGLAVGMLSGQFSLNHKIQLVFENVFFFSDGETAGYAVITPRIDIGGKSFFDIGGVLMYGDDFFFPFVTLGFGTRL